LRPRKDGGYKLEGYSSFMKLDSKITIKRLLEKYPCALTVFIERRMLCVGCPTEAYHTLEDVARIHGCDVEELLNSLQRTLERE
jgi:hybrid cluster-associated redox disulfide protein